MPFTPIEKANILFFLGYSGFEDDGPAMRAINSLDNFEKTMGPIIRDLLDKLAQVDRDIHETRPLAKAVKDGSIELRAHYTLSHLWNLGRSYVTRMARWTKIQAVGDVFGSGGSERGERFYSGDSSQGVPALGDIGAHIPGSGYWK
jgi:hypothetical protein